MAVLVVPLVLVAALEGVLRIAGSGQPTSFFIPGGQEDRYLTNPRFGWRFFGKDLAREPIAATLARRKAPRTYRIFVFGGSAAAGEPHPAFSFGRVVQAMLRDRYPDTRFELINTSMAAINSHVVRSIVDDCADMDGDLFIVYLGNNEVVGPYGVGSTIRAFTRSGALIRASLWLRATRIGQLIRRAAGAIAGDGPARRRRWRGMEMFLERRVAASDPRLRHTLDHLRANLRHICEVGRSAGARVLVATVLTNLRDQPPFASVHHPGLAAGERARWERLEREGQRLARGGDHGQAVARLEAALEIDDRHAGLRYRLGRSYLALGRRGEARRHLVMARDLDALRFRADTQTNRIIREVAGGRQGQGIHLVDAARLRELPGNDLLHEHVHLNFTGNHAVARLMYERIVAILPRAIRGPGPSRPAPSIQRCSELMARTPLDRLTAVSRIAAMLSRPPFGPEQRRRALAAQRRLSAQVDAAALAEAERRYRRALRRRPGDLLLRDNLTAALLMRGDVTGAVAQLERLLRRYPLSADWRLNLGRAWFRLGKLEEARAAYERALSLRPHDAAGVAGLGEVLEAQGDPRGAMARYRQALTLDPDSRVALQHLAWIRAAHRDDALRDGPQAVAHARRVQESGHVSPELLDVLAAAHAESGQFDEAVSTARRAREMAFAGGQTELGNAISRRIGLYLQRRPFRLP